MPFDSYIGIDYSGAATPQHRSATIQVYESNGAEPNHVLTPMSADGRKRNWNRVELYQWLAGKLQESQRYVIGLDHGFGFPISYLQRYQLKTWDRFLFDFSEHWPTSQSGVTVQQFRPGSQRVGDSSEFRLTEQWTSSAKSVFQFDVNGSVAKSTHAGLPFLLQLRKEFKQTVHFWPFDGWDVPPKKSVIAEIYPSLFRNRYPRCGRTSDQQDAFAVSRWLSERDTTRTLETFLHPPLNRTQQKQARLEGWILGVY